MDTGDKREPLNACFYAWLVSSFFQRSQRTLTSMHTDNKDKELPVSDFEGKVIHPGESLQLNACGRSDASSGTTGDFDLVDPASGDKVIRHFYWDCPWGSKTNTWTVKGSNSKFIVESTGANLDSGALGTITVEVLNKPGH